MTDIQNNDNNGEAEHLNKEIRVTFRLFVSALVFTFGLSILFSDWLMSKHDSSPNLLFVNYSESLFAIPPSTDNVVLKGYIEELDSIVTNFVDQGYVVIDRNSVLSAPEHMLYSMPSFSLPPGNED